MPTHFPKINPPKSAIGDPNPKNGNTHSIVKIKKIKNIKNNKVRIMKWEFYDEKKFKIIENSFCDIKKSINKKLRIQI